MGWKDTITHSEQPNPTSSWKDTIRKEDQDNASIKDYLTMVGQGATMGFGDEILGGIEATKDIASGESDLSDLYNRYRKHQQENQAAYKESADKTGGVGTATEIVGGLLPSVLTGGATIAPSALKSIATMTGLGALNAAGSSEENLDNPLEYAKDIGSGSLMGGALGLGGKVLGKLGELTANELADTNIANKVSKVFNNSLEGKRYTGLEAKKVLGEENKEAVENLTKMLLNPRDEAGQLYGQVLKDASSKGIKIDNQEDLMKAIDTLKSSGVKLKGDAELLAQHGTSSYDPLTLGQKVFNISPEQAKSAQLALRNLPSNDTTRPIIQEVGQSLGDAIKRSLPENEYNQINRIFSQSNKPLEALLNKSDSELLQNKKVSDLIDGDLSTKVNDRLKTLLNQMGDESLSGRDKSQQVQDLLNSIKNVNTSDKIKYIDENKFKETLDKAASDNSIYKSIYGEYGGGVDKLNMLQAIKASPLWLSETAGRLVGSTKNSIPGKVIGNIYNASNDVLTEGASRLKSSKYSHLGDALQNAIDNKITTTKNATLFSIMQNPEARKLFNYFPENDNEGNSQK